MLQRHATDAVSLVFGTIFAGVTAVWLLNVTDVIDLESAWLAGPAILIVAGVVGLAAALRPSRHATPTPATWGALADNDADTGHTERVETTEESTPTTDEHLEATDEPVVDPDGSVEATAIDVEGTAPPDADSERRD